jgi:predicted dehydrogenase
MLENPLCRWGILSTAGIAKKNWRSIAKSTSGTVVALASRRLEAANQFIEECQFSCPQSQKPDAVVGYEALLKRQDVDAVYIPLPTGIRKEWIIAAADQGKHILAEKPTALSSTDMEEILSACQRNQVQFMDGVMFMHSARMPRMHEVLNDGQSIGKLKRIACHFSFYGGDEFSRNNIRVDSVLEPFGCLGDLGWYCIRFLLWANQWQMPTEAVGKVIQSGKGSHSEATVPTEFSAELAFPNGSTGSFYCSFHTCNQQWAHISGTHGNVFVRDFVLPHFGSEVAFDVEKPTFVANGCDFHMREHTQRMSVPEYSNGYSPAQEINMVETFNQLVLSKQIDLRWGEMSLKTQRVLDQLFSPAPS